MLSLSLSLFFFQPSSAGSMTLKWPTPLPSTQTPCRLIKDPPPPQTSIRTARRVSSPAAHPASLSGPPPPSICLRIRAKPRNTSRLPADVRHPLPRPSGLARAPPLLSPLLRHPCPPPRPIHPAHQLIATPWLPIPSPIIMRNLPIITSLSPKGSTSRTWTRWISYSTWV
jgi:hypothetical protein